MDKKKINIEQLKKEQLFQVPEGYFEQLSSKIETRIALEVENEESSILSTDALNNKEAFQLPANYFESLQSKIEAKTTGINANEEVVLNPDLFSKVHPFQVPEGYFKGLPATVMRKTESKKSKWIIKLNWLPQSKWVLAPAMMIALVFGYFLFFNQNKGLTSDELIAQVSTDDLIAYLDASDISTEDILESVSADDFSYELDINDKSIIDEIEINDEVLDEFLEEEDFSFDV